MGQIQSIGELISMLKRRFWVIVFIAFAGSLFSVYYALQQPKTYQATAVIQIESPQVQGATGTTPSNGTHRLQLIQQRLMARDNLIAVIDKHELFADTPMGIAEKVFQLRISTRIDQITDGVESWRPGAQPSGLSVTVTLSDAQKAADVANEFLASLMEENRQRREAVARETLEFFSEEQQRLEAQITALESTLADFKRENVDALPSNVTQLRTQMGVLEENLLELDQQIITLQSNPGRQRTSVLEEQQRLLEEQKDLINTRMQEINALLTAAPRVERQYNALTRELQQLQDQYSVATRRRAEAEMGQVLEARNQTERFEILETALVPENPISASRKKVAMLGGFVSLILGLGAAFVLEMLNPAIRNAAQLERALGVSPVVSIPDVSTKSEQRQRAMKWIGAAILVLAAIPFLARAVNDRLMPLRFLNGN